MLVDPFWGFPSDGGGESRNSKDSLISTEWAKTIALREHLFTPNVDREEEDKEDHPVERFVTYSS